MSWTTPRSWVTGEVVTASIMNVHVRDNFLALIAGTCYAYKNGSQTVTAGNTTALGLDTEIVDTGAWHDNATNNSRITPGVAGKYLALGRSSVTNNNNGTGTLHLYKTGSALTPNVKHSFETAAANWEDQELQVSSIIALGSTDYLELRGQAVTNDFTFGATQLILHGPLAAGN